eukprot:scaffold22559_cov111-Cylindrotheca_fusiformis.AAC.8
MAEETEPIVGEEPEVIGDIQSPRKRESTKKKMSKLDSFTKPQYTTSSHPHPSENTPAADALINGTVRDRDMEHGSANTEQEIDQSKVLKTRNSSMLPSSEDPFAYREGKTLLWRDINMTLAGKKDSGPDIKLLDGVWGEVPEERTTAIMGPSGAGKTSLLNILAGRAASRGRITIDAEIRLNNYIVDPKKIEVRQHIAFVAQDDSLQVTSTPREAIYFSAKLRLPRDTEEKTLIKLTNRMLRELGLESCADTYVGGALLKGISGGERKRTSIGVELVVKPSMVFLDEPTSGLDSYSAMQVCRVLQKVARAGSSVLFTIHQPASEVFNEFDQLILLNKGRVMYQGAVDDVPDYFEARGHPLPPKYNPADWIMNVAQSIPIDELNQLGFFPEDDRDLPDPDTEIFVDGKDESGHTHGDELDNVDTKTATLLTQMNLLYSRELKNIARDKGAVGARFGLTIFLSLLIGIIFFEVGDTDSANAQASFGMFYITIFVLAMASTAMAVMLGCSVEEPKLGQELLPLLFVPQMLFAGFFVVPDLIPIWLRWAQYLCSLTYAIRIILVEEFGDGCGSEEADEACLGLISSVGANEDEVWWNWLVLILLFVVLRLLALVILRQKAIKFF